MIEFPKLTKGQILGIVFFLILSLGLGSWIAYDSASKSFETQEKSVNQEFNQFFSIVKTYSNFVVDGDSLIDRRCESILNDPYFPLFQFRMVSEDGMEMVKLDTYGYNNKNDISSRPYWQDVKDLQPGSWHVTIAQTNWENDSISGKQVETAHNTFRFFYRTNRIINGLKNPYLIFNVDYTDDSQNLLKSFTNLNLEQLNPEMRYEEGISFGLLSFKLQRIIYVRDGENVFPVVLMTSTFSVLWILFVTLALTLSLLWFYLNVLDRREIINKQLEQEKLQNQFVQNWINMASHYFRHPVANITSNLDILKLKKIFKEDNQEVKNILSSLDEFITIFQHLQKINVLNHLDERVRSHTPIKSVFKQLHRDFKQKICTRINIHEDTQIYCDSETLEWALIELVENSIHHGQSARVEIIVHRIEDEIDILVEDDGIGLNKEFVDALNNNKVEFKSSGIEDGKFGLGYYQILRILHMHGFKLSVESSLGKGTMVCITVPSQYVIHGTR